MKYVLIALSLLSFEAFAATPEINPRLFTCDQLQEFINEHGEVLVHSRVLGFKVKKLVGVTATCTKRMQYTAPAFYKTKDKRECYAGDYCEYERVEQCYDNSCID